MKIGIVSLIHPRYHGSHEKNASYLVEQIHCENEIPWDSLARCGTEQRYTFGKERHPDIRNYWPYTRTLGIELVTEWTSNDGACYAVLHTWVIRMIQKKWRVLMDQKCNRLVELSTYSALEYQKRHGSCIPTKLHISPWWKSRYSWMA